MKIHTPKDIVASQVKVGDRVKLPTDAWITVTRVTPFASEGLVALRGETDEGYLRFTCKKLTEVLPGEELSYACCTNPQVRGGRCENCGEWLEDMEREGRL